MSSLAAATYSIDDLPEWESFQSSSPQGTVFSSTEWLRFAAETRGMELSIRAVREDGKLLCAIPCFRKRVLGIPVATSHPLTPYQNLIISHHAENETVFLRAVEGTLRLVTADTGFASLSLHPACTDLRPFAWAGWNLHHLYTYIIDIRDIDSVWRGYSSSLRRKLRRAQEAGIVVAERADVDIFLEQHRYSYARHGIKPPIPVETVQTWISGALQRGGRMFIAYDKAGTPLASRMTIHRHPHVYDWIAGSSEQSEEVSANHALVDAILRTFSQDGYTSFDFRGANTPGVIEFKRSFGGALVPYSEAVYNGSSIISALQGMKARLTRLRRRL